MKENGFTGGNRKLAPDFRVDSTVGGKDMEVGPEDEVIAKAVDGGEGGRGENLLP
jgi:hypothetical protein